VLPRGARAEAAAPFVEALRARFLPNVVRAVVDEGDLAAFAQVAPFLEGKAATGGKPTAYVCERGACQLPTHDPSTLAAELTAVASY
jgi:hypothetical protein